MQCNRALRLLFIGCVVLAGIAGCASMSGFKNAWTTNELATELASPTRPQMDRDRDADRKPADLMTFFGVQKGMTVLDVIAAGGYMTDVLATAVGPKGKVYQKSASVLKISERRLRQGALRSPS